VQLSLACDAIIGKLAEQRPDLALAFLCTPTDCHASTKPTPPFSTSAAVFVLLLFACLMRMECSR